jgi:nucleoid DNA-binding protein
MLITREKLIKRLSNKSGYWQKDIKNLLKCLDEVVLGCLDEVTDEEEVVIQLLTGIKCGCKVVPERTRKDPRDQSDIVCAASIKPFVRFSEDFRKNMQERYEKRKDG